MHRIKLFLLLLVIPLAVFAAAVPKTEVTLLGHVTQRVDGTAVVVDGYRFYVSKIAGSKPGPIATTTVPESANDIAAKLTALAPPPANGNHYVVATSYKVSVQGTEESGSSNEVAFYAVGDGTYFIAAPLAVPASLQLR